MTIVLPISPVLLHIGPQFKCQYLCFRCLGTFANAIIYVMGPPYWISRWPPIVFTLLCISLSIALWKENKDSLHQGKCLLSGNCHHMAAISEFLMATTLLDMQFSMIDICRLPCQLSLRKLLYRHFAQMAAIFNFPTRLHCRSFSVSLSIPRCITTYHSSSRLLITSPSTFAKWGAFQVCLETIAINVARLSTFA